MVLIYQAKKFDLTIILFTVMIKASKKAYAKVPSSIINSFILLLKQILYIYYLV